MKISFILVNYRSRDFLQQCLDSLFEHAPSLSHEIIIVNNDKELLSDFSKNPGLKIIENGKNIGFGRACNLAVQASIGDVLFFLNPDTKILTSDLAAVIEPLNNPAIAITAPLLITNSGTIQPWSAGQEITPWRTLLNNLGDKQDAFFQKQVVPSEADWVSGGAFAVRKKTFLECGGFDEKFFLYFEDIDLCKRLRSIGKKIAILPSVKVLHFGGKSVLNTKKQKEFYYQSQDYYFKKHFGTVLSLFIKTLRSVFLLFKKL